MGASIKARGGREANGYELEPIAVTQDDPTQGQERQQKERHGMTQQARQPRPALPIARQG